MTGEPLIGAKQAAEFLGLALNTVYIMARGDQLPHYRFGATVRFRHSDLERWLEEKRRGPA